MKFPYSEFDSITEQLAKINGIQNVNKFLNPSIEDTYSPGLLKNMDIAVELFHKNRDKKFTIFGDCDNDGISSAAIIYRYLQQHGIQPQIIHAQRHLGHGLRTVEDLIPSETEILIIVDSSSSDLEECKRVSEKGIKILILDHHEIENIIPLDYAIVINPKQKGCQYKNKEASGGLITYKFCEALDEYYSTDYAEDLIHIAGFSLLADAMSVLEPENRYYIDYALKNVTNLGFLTLFNELKKSPIGMNATDYSFSIAPCITAITRAGEMEKAIQLLISDDQKECKKLAKELIESNEVRKKMQEDAVGLVKDRIDENDKIIVIVEPSYGKSYNGVVAQEISKKYQRPAIILGEGKNASQYAGSFRSYGGFNVRDFLKTLKTPLFSAGHDQSGGTAIWKNKLNDFKKEINAALKDVTFEQELIYDLELTTEELTFDLIKEIVSFYRITGRDFQPGLFLIKNLFVEDKNPLSKKFENFEHIKISCEGIDVVKFKTNKDYFDKIPVFTEIDVIGSLKVNEYERYDRSLRRSVVERNRQLFLEEYHLSIKQ